MFFADIFEWAFVQMPGQASLAQKAAINLSLGFPLLVRPDLLR